jgi:hypothetical protein
MKLYLDYSELTKDIHGFHPWSTHHCFPWFACHQSTVNFGRRSHHMTFKSEAFAWGRRISFRCTDATFQECLFWHVLLVDMRNLMPLFWTVQSSGHFFLFFTLLIHSNFDLTGCHVPANRRSAKYGTGAAGSHHLHCLGLNSECFQCFLHSVPVLTEFPPLCRIRCNWEYSFLICIPFFALVLHNLERGLTRYEVNLCNLSEVN